MFRLTRLARSLFRKTQPKVAASALYNGFRRFASKAHLRFSAVSGANYRSHNTENQITVNKRWVDKRDIAFTNLKTIMTELKPEESNEEEKHKWILVYQIVTDEVIAATASEHSQLFALINSLPKRASYESKIEQVKMALINYCVQAVLTAHPTMVFSNKTLFQLHHLTELFLSLCLEKNEDVQLNLQKEIKEILKTFLDDSLLPPKNLTPEEEAERALFIYRKILETYPRYLESIVNYFTEQHGGSKIELEEELREAVMRSMRVYSWVHGDADGNVEITAKTMGRTIPKQQIAIITSYREKMQIIIDGLQEIAPNSRHLLKLIEKQEYLGRCIDAIEEGIWFDVEESERVQADFQHLLSGVLSEPELGDTLALTVKHTRDLISLAGFAGGLREFVRQTTVQYTEVMDKLVSLIADSNFSEFNQLLEGDNKRRAYHELSFEEKAQVLKILGYDPKYFKAIKKKKTSLDQNTNKELERLYFVLQNNTIFPYHIFSDTESAVNFEEARVIARLGQFLFGHLKIGEMRQHPALMMPLCESPEAISRIEDIMNAILSDPHMRQKISEQGYLSYVSGPSDVAKRGGIMTYFALVRAQYIVEEAFRKYQQRYPELKNVKLRILHGYGGDMKRRIGAERQLHSTHQGAAAYYALGSPNAYYKFLHRVGGMSSEADNKVAELRELMCSDPEAYRVLLALMKSCVAFFESHIDKKSTHELLNAMTYPEVEGKANTSSRAGSKELDETGRPDASKARAIGVLNHWLLSGRHDDLILSLFGGSKSLSKKDKKSLPTLFATQTAMKEIVYKIFYALATNQSERAWRKVTDKLTQPSREEILHWSQQYCAGEGSEVKHVMAFHEVASFEVLQFLLSFVEEKQSQKARQYLQENETRLFKADHSVAGMAQALLPLLGGEFAVLGEEVKERLPRYDLLSKCLAAHEKNSSERSLENATLAVRAARYGLFAGPPSIANLRCPPEVLYKDGSPRP